MAADRTRKAFDTLYLAGSILIAALAGASVFLPLDTGVLVTAMGSVLGLLVVAAWIDKACDRRRRETAARVHAEQQAAEDAAYAQMLTDEAENDTREAAAGRKRVACWVDGAEFYTDNDDHGDERGRYNCGSGGCQEAY